MSALTCAANYKVFGDLIHLEKADADQREFARRCFYAGFHSAFVTITKGIGDMDNASQAVAAFNALEEEMFAHLSALMTGDA